MCHCWAPEQEIPSLRFSKTAEMRSSFAKSWPMAAHSQRDPDADGSVQASMQFSDKDEHVYFWFPLLAGLSELTFDPRPDIRYSALEVCALGVYKPHCRSEQKPHQPANPQRVTALPDYIYGMLSNTARSCKSIQSLLV